ncbi:hypothetical protein J4T94_gp057 [Mycobacterium phage Krypton555]|uniref:Uncharacterized protein n=1 Tax=Mycobacterium phage Krypton555 TaxID=2015885 RepID=A0A222ZRY7_9CAUD|nr:hypothetical protein J4T94_gp057 [Mycobacterium phage Krypton555]ASR87159.1 hypothetical protein KRYPTON555_135 [Mycobacterium phage Krypton555]
MGQGQRVSAPAPHRDPVAAQVAGSLAVWLLGRAPGAVCAPTALALALLGVCVPNGAPGRSWAALALCSWALRSWACVPGRCVRSCRANAWLLGVCA